VLTPFRFNPCIECLSGSEYFRPHIFFNFFLAVESSWKHPQTPTAWIKVTAVGGQPLETIYISIMWTAEGGVDFFLFYSLAYDLDR